jgi:diacylglycerol kinase family enzyme
LGSSTQPRIGSRETSTASIRDPIPVTATDIDPETLLQHALAGDEVDEKRRLLLLVNPYATTVSDSLRTVVISALRGVYIVDAVDTERRDHATELCREAAGEGYDAIVAFGGDGTVNEAANGLVGSSTPLTCLPGGRANVYCRMLGIPANVIEATEHLLQMSEHWHPRKVDLAHVDGRHFLFSSGVGLDASVVERVDSNPELKARLGEYYYAWVATATYSRRYLMKPPRLGVRVAGGAQDGSELEGVTVLVQNANPYTYFGDRGVDMASGATLNSGDLAGLVLKRTNPLDIPTVAWRALSPRAKVADHRQVEEFTAARAVHVRSLDSRPLPIQVDGDYIGSRSEFDFGIAPKAITVVS